MGKDDDVTASELEGSSPALRAQTVESVAHSFAGIIHAQMGAFKITVGNLKISLSELGHKSTDFVDDLLAAKNPHSIRLSDLSDVLYLLGLDIRMSLNEPRGSSAAEAPTSAEGVTPTPSEDMP